MLTSRCRTGRSVRGTRLPPCTTFDERREVERVVVKGLLNMTGDLKGDYFPLAGSRSYQAKPNGMTAEKEEALRSRGNLFQVINISKFRLLNPLIGARFNSFAFFWLWSTLARCPRSAFTIQIIIVYNLTRYLPQRFWKLICVGEWRRPYANCFDGKGRQRQTNYWTIRKGNQYHPTMPQERRLWFHALGPSRMDSDLSL